ncbi:MAG: hypothetical protein ABIJ34_01210 [archaeon]
MKRKVVKHGPSTLTISLPSKWCRENAVIEGDELEICENNTSIIIKSELKPDQEKISIDVSGYDLMIGRILAAYYRKGIDNFEIRYSNSAELDEILKIIHKLFIGLEIVEQRDDKIILKRLAALDSEEFNNMYRKIFLLIKDISSESYDAMLKHNFLRLSSLILLDRNINRFSDFCIRLICKEGIKLKYNGTYHHLLADKLEEIGDKYRDINKLVFENKLKIQKDIVQIFKETNDFFDYFYEMFYNFQLQKIRDFGKKKAILSKKIESELNKNSDLSREFLLELKSIVKLIFDMYDALIIINS